MIRNRCDVCPHFELVIRDLITVVMVLLLRHIKIQDVWGIVLQS